MLLMSQRRIVEEYYLYVLDSTDENAKQNAADKLEALSCTRTQYVLYRFRSGSDRYLEWGVELLASAGSEAVEPLSEMLRDKSISLRMRTYAAKALGRIGVAAWKASDTLLEYMQELQERNLPYNEVIISLGGMDPADNKVTTAIAAMLISTEVSIRYSAAVACRALGVCVTHLVPALAAGLELSVGTAYGAETSSVIVDTLAVCGPASVIALDALKQTLYAEWPRLRSGAAMAMGAIGSGAKEVIGDLEDLLHDENEEVRNAAAEALRHIRTVQ
jgi:HEAT repeat protein